MPDAAWWLTKLEADGLVHAGGSTRRTTKRWQAAMARAAARLYESPHEDLRAAVAFALVELYGTAFDDEAIATALEVMLPIERAELESNGR
jgi:hypothetical protein